MISARVVGLMVVILLLLADGSISLDLSTNTVSKLKSKRRMG
ncbi:hypothetical protein X566_23210 [Afipia sp. P52-10]|nr:hypothetical protein X566_23210 [Afipia sp. P52-10]